MKNPSVLLRTLLIVLGYGAVLFGLWQSAAPPSVAAGPPDLARAGRRVWLRGNCIACHALYGLGGFLGPDLTNVHSRRGPAYVGAVVRHGLGPMPAFPLSAEERAQLLAYLAAVDASGVYPPQGTPFPVFGQSRPPKEPLEPLEPRAP